MANQTNTPRDWRLLAERDLSVAEHLAGTMHPVPTEIIVLALCSLFLVKAITQKTSQRGTKEKKGERYLEPVFNNA